MVPVSGPVVISSLFAGDNGSTFGSTSSQKYFVASPREPRYSSAHFMFSGSLLQVPAFRSTRRIFLVHPMVVSLQHRGVGPARPLAHLLQAGPFGIDIGDRGGRACLDALRVAAAQVALLHLAGIRDVVDGAERAGDGAYLAADTRRLEHDLGAGRGVDLDRLDRARGHAPR